MERGLSLRNGVGLAERALILGQIQLWSIRCPMLHAKLNKCVSYTMHVLRSDHVPCQFKKKALKILIPADHYLSL